ncbi:hypothetical protein LOD99_13306 [Oopsacas minuta]|uniref:Uncharacterized protein n=1 Tax=Oopsacas minuta TaxID=111878 RepID=A0AAV7KMN8_9METZ|nr:hypothetical protein LOD99_13306 [Oopsacas minuta]
MLSNLQSAIRPVEHSTEFEVSKPKKVSFDDDTVEYAMLDQDDEEFIPPPMPPDKTRLPHIINQSELNDLVRDLNLTKDQSELLGSRLKVWNLLDEETKVSFFRTRQSDFSVHFEMQGPLCYCNNVDRLMELLGVQHEQSEWRLFIDSSKYSLKAVFFHKGNVLPSIPIGHSVHMKESLENMDILLKLIRYFSYNWHICGDLKDSRARQSHYIVKEWPLRHQLTAGTKSVSCQSLVNPEKILLPPLHIKLVLTKNFVKAIVKYNEEGEGFKYLKDKFPKVRDAKIKEGIFIGPQIRELFKDLNFEACLNSVLKTAWNSFKSLNENFFRN